MQLSWPSKNLQKITKSAEKTEEGHMVGVVGETMSKIRIKQGITLH